MIWIGCVTEAEGGERWERAEELRPGIGWRKKRNQS